MLVFWCESLCEQGELVSCCGSWLLNKLVVGRLAQP
jgi:hypothetical protein